jgi:iron complex outermembrane receptor protein
MGADAGLYLKISPGSSMFTWGILPFDNVYQRANRFRLQDYFIQQHGIQFHRVPYRKLYFNNENTGKS